ncbi:hypothetical protein HDE_13949 [Halotydeus destructor]|nr:hypothetical protein HDE_13949 [Halotydeus destructor]
MMKLIIAVILVAGSAYATETWDCKIPGSVIHSQSADISPSPIMYPGDITVSADLVSDKQLPSENLYIKLHLEKQTPTKLLVPCFQGYGSCEYDVCNHVIPNNEKAFCAMGICHCPFMQKEYKGQNIPYTLPNIGGGIFAKIMEGDYLGNATFFNKLDGTVYGCIGMKFTIKDSNIV